MITDPKVLGDMGFNLAITASYALPEVGAALGAQIAAGQFLFDMLYPPGPGLDDPDQMVPTNASLQSKLDSLAKTLVKDSFDQQYALWAAKALKENTRLKDIAKLMYQHLSNPSLKEIEQWKKDVEDSFKPEVDLLDAENWVLLEKDDHCTETFDLYSLIGSVQIAFYKLHVLWRYNDAIESYPSTLAEYNKQVQQHTIWVNGGRQGNEPYVMEKPLEVGSDQDAQSKKTMAAFQKHFLKNCSPATSLATCIERLTGDNSYGPELAKEMLDHWKDRQDQIDKRKAEITVTSNANGWFWLDLETGARGTPTHVKALADAQADVQRGTVELAIFRNLTDSYQLTDLTHDQIQKFSDTINKWKQLGDELKKYDPSILTAAGN